MRRAGLFTLCCVLAACGRPNLGNTAAGELRASLAEVDFGDVTAGQRAIATVQFQNAGKVAATAELVLVPPFDGPAVVDVPGGSAVDVVLGFRPIAEGPYETTLTFGAQTLTLRGRARAAPVCRAAPDACVTSAFDPTAAMCVETPKPDGVGCATRCVPTGACASGACAGALADCSDGDACTEDACSDELGCVHPKKECPKSTNPCRVAACDPKRGCVYAEAADGTPCGPKSCNTNTIRVCIAAQCVDRPLPTAECLLQFGYLKATNTGAEDAFGLRIALSADGSTMAVGAPGERSNAKGVGGNQNNDQAPYSGAVYIYVRSGGQWLPEAYLKASNTDLGDGFGYAVALSATGDVLVVGAQLEDGRGKGVDGDPEDDSEPNAGAAYVYRRSGSTWAHEAYLKASNTQQGDAFGFAVAISGDGETIAVGAQGEDSKSTGIDGDQLDETADDSGAVYVFRLGPPGWRQEAYVKASTVEGGDQFGFALALSDDGNTLAVSAPGDDSNTKGLGGDQKNNLAPQSGAVRLFQRTLSWSEAGYFKASNPGPGDSFGISVALSSDGKTLAAGAWSEDSSATGINGNELDNAASQSGAAYVFAFQGNRWGQQAYLKAINTAPGDDYGFALALSGDGAALAIGAWSENSGATGIDGHPFNNGQPDSGAVYLYRRRPMGWATEAYVKSSNTEAADHFGYAVALSTDGTTVAIGAIGEDSAATGVNGVQTDNNATDSGAVYVFSRK